jgi:hypothetical protein
VLISGSLLWDSSDGAKFTLNSPHLDPSNGQMPTQTSVRVEVPRKRLACEPVGCHGDTNPAPAAAHRRHAGRGLVAKI